MRSGLAPNTGVLNAHRQKSKAVAFEVLFCAGDVHARVGVGVARRSRGGRGSFPLLGWTDY